MEAQAVLLALLAAWAISGKAEATNVQRDLYTVEMGMFKDFMVAFNKSYGSQNELELRFQIFRKNLAQARRLQVLDQGTAEYGVTQFSDLTDEEFLGLRRLPKTMPAQTIHVDLNESHSQQKNCDWRKFGVPRKIRYQGQCGSCWACAAASNIDYLWEIGGEPRTVSVQELIDCDNCTSRDGCKGGWVWDAFMTVLRRRGLSSEEEYPYKEKKGRCKERKGNAAARIHDFAMVEKDETKMAEYVATNGPITVVINSTALKAYKKGIIKLEKKECKPSPVNHAVLLVGYGVLKTGGKEEPYWILQNSWGEEYGEKGYFRLSRGTNMCGITKYPVTAIRNRRKRVSCPS
ncbi:hypothetical protein NDU88_003339 [Pleurodeles waltl]|uniref:Uncharacterized protein n=1 Tax=Pleurodeles waltl TaxID=8319 RepID=A0AAV7MQ90_PLEWA|nr:hypothetical protein NDU88_003339 [Pleurodeles waltl]